MTMHPIEPDPKWKPAHPGESIYDTCQRCGHFRLSHWDPLTGKMSRCRRCRGYISGNVPRQLGHKSFPRTEDPGQSCPAFLEIQLPERH